MTRRTLLPLALAAAFGAADQYLGSGNIVHGYWTVEVSLLSAPWLLVAFFAGWAQETRERAAIIGTAASFAALAGYWTMGLTPLEGAHVSLLEITGLLGSNHELLVGAAVTGPLFGWLGYRWHTHGDWLSALIAALAVCFEPLAHAAVGDPISFRDVWGPEVLVGMLMVAYVVLASTRRGQTA